jgi:ArsR family transcriptional regulator
MPTCMLERTAELFKALMHPERLAILGMLREGERCVCEIEQELGHRQAYVSQQLGVLRNAGLVAQRREGWRVFYRLARPEILTVIAAAQGIATQASPAMSTLGQLTSQEVTTTC